MQASSVLVKRLFGESFYEQGSCCTFQQDIVDDAHLMSVFMKFDVRRQVPTLQQHCIYRM